jgi:TetR/AcrR family transcriptional repressor of nem operon
MTRRGSETKERILDTAEALILDLGFAATSIDRVIDGAGITKGAFFYHFGSKAEMAHALVERYAQRDTELLEGTLARAEKLARDPLERFLVFLGLFEEYAETVTGPNPGCLFASYIYEAQLFDEATKQIISAQFLRWRRALRSWLDRIVEQHPPRRDVDLDEVADLLSTVFEGGFVMAKSLRDPRLIARHLAHYRNYIELLFVTERALAGSAAGAAGSQVSAPAAARDSTA